MNVAQFVFLDIVVVVAVVVEFLSTLSLVRTST